MVRSFLVYVIASLSVALAVSAEERKLVVGAGTLPGVFDETGEGPYHKFFRDVVAAGPVKVSLVRMPMKRVTRAFFDQQIDCLYMANDNKEFYQGLGYSPERFVTSIPFNSIYMRAFSRVDAPVVNALDQMEGRLIAADEGVHVSTIAQRLLPFANRILYTATIDEAFGLLASKRVDTVVAYGVDAMQYRERTGDTQFHFDDQFVLISMGEGLNCWPSDAADELVGYVNDQLRQLSASGTLAADYQFKAAID